MSDFIVNRVVIACDAVGENRASIEAAARFAAWWNAALRGVFMQDEALFNLAGLPFARHVGPSGDVSTDFDETTLLHQFEAHATRVRAALEAAAHEHAVGWSFDVVRGLPTLATLSLDEQDLLVIEETSRPFVGDFRLDSRWLEAALEAHRPILLLRGNSTRRDGIVALIKKAGPSAERTIAAAARLAQAGNRRLTVLLTGEGFDLTKIEALLRNISEKVAAHCRIEQGSFTGISLELVADRDSLLVVDAEPAANDIAALKELTAHTRADILFVR